MKSYKMPTKAKEKRRDWEGDVLPKSKVRQVANTAL